jgi:hypothetical protein
MKPNAQPKSQARTIEEAHIPHPQRHEFHKQKETLLGIGSWIDPSSSNSYSKEDLENDLSSTYKHAKL